MFMHDKSHAVMYIVTADFILLHFSFADIDVMRSCFSVK